MYKCQVTGKFSKKGDSTAIPPVAGEKLHKIVVETRERTYTKWVRNDENAANISSDLVVNHSQDNKWLEVVIGRGWEIVREINATAEGVRLWESWTPEERAEFLKGMN